MTPVLFNLGTLLSGMVATVLQTLAHNGWVLAFSIVTAVALKTYVDTEKLSRYLTRRSRVSILLSVAVGAFTPFCACGTMAVIVGMLTTALPWGPIMAFLTSSPLMSPDGFLMISGMISLRFALALTAASVLIGIGAGFATQWIERHTRLLGGQARYLDAPAHGACGCQSQTAVAGPACQRATATCRMDASVAVGTPVTEPAGTVCCAAALPAGGALAAWADRLRVRQLLRGLVDVGLRQILLYFVIFVAVGYLVNTLVPADIVSALLGADNAAAVPLAAAVGLPLYLTTESSIPIIRSLLQSGASEGAMLAFIISGSATSAWVIAGLTTFMRKRALALYVTLILVGSILCGYGYGLLLTIL